MSPSPPRPGAVTRFSQWGDRIGRWNPQLLREWRGRLSPKSVALTITASLAVQGLIAFLSSFAMTGDIWTIDYWGHTYSQLVTTYRGCFLMLVGALGGYSLAQDWAKEAERGTLEFIRMAPEPSDRILMGKLLGVPILYYIAVLPWLPVHLALMVQGDVPLLEWLLVDGFNMTLLAAALVITLTTSVWSQRSGIGTGIFIGVLGFWVMVLVQAFGEVADGLHWFGVNVVHSPASRLAMAIAIGLTITALCFKAAQRRLDQPNATVFPRRQVYPMMLGFNLVLAGFFFTSSPFSETGAFTIALIVAGLWLIAGLIFWLGTMPSRQSLVDWSRDRHLSRDRHRPLRQWIWKEGSPPLMVPAIHLGLTGLMWIPIALGLIILGDRPMGTGLLTLTLLLSLGLPINLTLASFYTWYTLARSRATAIGVSTLSIAYLGTLSTLAFSGSVWGVGLGGLILLLGTFTSVHFVRQTLAKLGQSESRGLLTPTAL